MAGEKGEAMLDGVTVHRRAVAKQRGGFPPRCPPPYDCFSIVNEVVVPCCLSWYSA